jgi:hypothetical protein
MGTILVDKPISCQVTVIFAQNMTIGTVPILIKTRDLISISSGTVVALAGKTNCTRFVRDM